MDYSDLSYSLSARKVRDVSTKFKRHIADTIDWNNRLISLSGARGTGKTTLLLQRIKTAFKGTNDALYISLDHLWLRRIPYTIRLKHMLITGELIFFLMKCITMMGGKH